MELLIIKNNHTIVNWESKSSLTKYVECISDDKVEILASKLSKNAKKKKFLITLLGLSLYCRNVFAAGKGIDYLGMTILNLIRGWSYWILIIWCVIEIVRSGDAKKTLPIVMKFVIIFASMYLVPTIFDAIKVAF